MPSLLLSRSVLRHRRLEFAAPGAAQRDGRAGAARERVVVAVRVEDGQDPELGRLQELRDPRVVLVREEPLRLAAGDLGGDPLARVVDGAEEHRRDACRRATLRASSVILSARIGLPSSDLPISTSLATSRLSRPLRRAARRRCRRPRSSCGRRRSTGSGCRRRSRRRTSARAWAACSGQRDALASSAAACDGSELELQLLRRGLGLEAGVVELDARSSAMIAPGRARRSSVGRTSLLRSAASAGLAASSDTATETANARVRTMVTPSGAMTDGPEVYLNLIGIYGISR